ncbi:hypothetical protein M9H77_28202 [Catharanthus roseus]|uniref:Uncharacterized protein n=1 Tax=Catharanthus roseus TaxID=4058 RepID=A0ACC0AF27_CATRO|nr:hypothetical protein M9H77_28202 [Catharanthus roseus]
MLFLATTTLAGRLGLFILGGVHPSLVAKEDIIIMVCVFPFISLPYRKHPPGGGGSDSLGQQLIEKWVWDFNVQALAGLVHECPVRRMDKRRRQRSADEKIFCINIPEESDPESNLLENEQSIWATGDKTTSLDNKKGMGSHLIIIIQ